MTIEVRIPTILRPYTKDQKIVSAQGVTLFEVIDDLEKNYRGLADRLIENGELRKFINVYINDEDVRFSGGLATPTKAGDSITILPAVAGGQIMASR
ncbi:MAG: MoaD/ThiS family protein [Actinobacteria bacterium]|nr:MoaD/ThiS family protein [Actinomycetota bacterium]